MAGGRGGGGGRPRAAVAPAAAALSVAVAAVAVAVLAVAGTGPAAGGAADVPPMRLTWPAPNPAFLEGGGIETFLQPTESGDPVSGSFGCVRNSGSRFHEGIDLFPLERDGAGEPADPVVAAADGVVVHVSSAAGHSGYGRYVVLEHPALVPAVYTLYAHLRSIDDGLRPGVAVARGERLGVMGRSAGGYTIPRERGHLHFEIGLRLSDDFQAWYGRQGFGSPNHHGGYNGMNLVGVDPLDFYRAALEGRARQPVDYLRSLPVAVTVRVRGGTIPDFARRYPVLVAGGVPERAPVAWEADFSRDGVPLALRPVGEKPARGGKWEIRGEPRETACMDLVSRVRGRWEPGKDLRENLELLFGPALR